MEKVALFLLIFSIIIIDFLRSQAPPTTELDKVAKYYSTFKSIECKNFDPNVTGYFRNCFIKAYSRTFVTLNFGYKLHKPLRKPFFVRVIVSYRYGNIYRDVINIQKEYCEVMDMATTHEIFQRFTSTFYKSVPGLFHKCPYEGEADFFNVTIDESKTRSRNLFPEGYYKVCIIISKPADKPIYSLCLVFYTKSPVKDSFG